ncbi:porin [Mycobacterium goodii]|nr:porin [Mycolicibacterium goodii]
MNEVCAQRVRETPPKPEMIARRTADGATEWVGTFLLFFTVGVGVFSCAPMVVLGAGAVLVVLIYAMGHMSGNHFNPAVTLAVVLRGRIRLVVAVVRWIAQWSSALSAAVAVRAILDPARTTSRREMVAAARLLAPADLAEFASACVLSYVVIGIATRDSGRLSPRNDIAVGVGVVLGALGIVALSDGVIHPFAGSVGRATTGLIAWPTLWTFLVTQVVVSASGGLAFLSFGWHGAIERNRRT